MIENRDDIFAYKSPEVESETRLLHQVFENGRRIIVYTGAGISTSAGLADFASPDGMARRLGGPSIFDEAVYQDANQTRLTKFHDYIRTANIQAERAQPTAFHILIDEMAELGCLLRNYTQNIDGIELKCPNLYTSVPLQPLGKEHAPIVVQIHGSLKWEMCAHPSCGYWGVLNPRKFDGPMAPPCPQCLHYNRTVEDMNSTSERHARRESGSTIQRKNSRLHRTRLIGKLRPRVLLYHHTPAALDTEVIGEILDHDLQTRPDAVIVAGTRLKSTEAKSVVKEICGKVHENKGITVWVNFNLPPKELDDSFDVVALGPCDGFAHIAQTILRERSDQREGKRSGR